MTSDQPLAPSLSDLQPGQSITLPLPAVYLGRRVAYQRIQRDAHSLFGAGNYRMSAAGPSVTVYWIDKPRRGHDADDMKAMP